MNSRGVFKYLKKNLTKWKTEFKEKRRRTVIVLIKYESAFVFR